MNELLSQRNYYMINITITIWFTFSIYFCDSLTYNKQNGSLATNIARIMGLTQDYDFGYPVSSKKKQTLYILYCITYIT